MNHAIATVLRTAGMAAMGAGFVYAGSKIDKKPLRGAMIGAAVYSSLVGVSYSYGVGTDGQLHGVGIGEQISINGRTVRYL